MHRHFTRSGLKTFDLLVLPTYQLRPSSHESFHYYKYICLCTFTRLLYNISPREAEQQIALFLILVAKQKTTD